MKIILGLIFFVFCTLSTNVYAQNNKHLVFVVHGVAANTNSVDGIKKALEVEAKNHDSQTDWHFINFGYQTGNHGKDVYIFAKELADFISKSFKNHGGLQPHDKFSLVMHSQGGLVGLRFLINSFLNQKDFHPELQPHLDAFITLSTPYWGSKVAIFGARILPILAYLKIPLPDKYGTRELEDMELASDFSAISRNILTDPANAEALLGIKRQSRFLVISAVTERLNILAPISTGRYRYEDDTAVPIPSSHLDFFYYKDSQGSGAATVNAAEFKATDLVDSANYIVVNAFHASPFPESKYFPGIVQLPKRCLNIPYRECNHPAYASIVQHLFDLERDPPFVRDLTSFAIDLKLNAHGESVSKKEMKLSFKSLTFGLKIGKDIELYNKVSRWSKVGDYRLYHTGYIDPKLSTTTRGLVEMTITIPRFKTRKVIVPVKTTMSSYIELDLEKID